MSTTAKAIKLAAELADRLKVRGGLFALGVTQKFDTDQNPLIYIGSGVATTNEAAIIKIEPIDWPLAVDVFGNAAIEYTPHSIHILQEAAPAGGLSSKDKLDIYLQCAAMGTEVKLYESTSGAGVVLADIDDATKLKETYAPDAYRPMISSQ